MCVIATGRKKDFELEWFKACCDHNPDGFFVSRVNRRQSIRTLDKAAAISFFESSKPNDLIVLHARIKSVGPVNSDNVHGWESAGVQFCHNGTLSIKARDTLTDSETFFRDIFLPIYKSTNRRLTKPVIAAINAVIGTSRFLVIRNKSVHRFGNFTAKGECYFSNMYWCSQTKPIKVNNSTTSTTTTSWFRGGENALGSNNSHNVYNDYDTYYESYWDSYDAYRKSVKNKTAATPDPINYPYTISEDIVKTLKSVSKLVSKGVLPKEAQILIGLDLLNCLDYTTRPVRSLNMACYPYRIFLYLYYFTEEWEGKDESLKKLSASLTQTPTSVYDKISNNSIYSQIHVDFHDKVPYTVRAPFYSDLNKKLRNEMSLLSDVTDAASSSTSDQNAVCDKWAQVAKHIFVLTFQRHFTYAGISSFVRSAAELLDTNDHAYLLYVVYTTMLEAGQMLRNASFDQINEKIHDFVTGLYNGTYTTATKISYSLLQFWSRLANEVLNRKPLPLNAPTTSVDPIWEAGYDALESFDADVTDNPISHPARYAKLVDRLRGDPEY